MNEPACTSLITYTNLFKANLHAFCFLCAACLSFPTGATENEQETLLKTTPHAIRDPALLNYLRAITCRLAPNSCNNIRIYISTHPHFHAEMHPNGVLHIWSGAFLRIANETELAGLLAHEIAHFELGHTHTSLSGEVSWQSALTGGLDLAWNEAKQSRISQQQERLADKLSLSLLHNAGYAPLAVLPLWQRLYRELKNNQATRRPNTLLRSHPTLPERIEYMREDIRLLSSPPKTKQLMATNYWTVLAPHYQNIMRDVVLLHDMPNLVFLLNQHRRFGFDSGYIAYFQGEYHRHQANLDKTADHFSQAIEAYQTAIAEKGPPEAHRALGLLLLKLLTVQGRKEAKRHIETYLHHQPDAPDKILLITFLDELL